MCIVSEVIQIFDRQNTMTDLQLSDCRRFLVRIVGISSGFQQREGTAYLVVRAVFHKC